MSRPEVAERFADAGFDLEQGAARHAGDARRYLTALCAFAEGRGEDAARARAALASGDAAGAARELHALGVVLNMLGAAEAAEVAVAVEWALRHGAAPQPGLDHLDRLLQRACAAVAQVDAGDGGG